MIGSARIARLLALLSLAVCGGALGARDGYTQRDSAGGSVTPAVRPRPGDELRLARQHSLSVPMGGHTTGGVHRSFGTALGTRDGGVLVAGGGEQSIRRYDAAGRLVATVTLVGSDAGAFRALFGFIRASGDTLIATDLARDRLAFLGPNGTVVREEPLRRHEDGLAAPFGYLGDGAVLMRMLPSVDEASAQSGVWRPTVRVTHRPAGGAAGVPVASLPGGEFVIFDDANGVQQVVDRAFGLCSCLVPQQDGFVYGTGETAELVRYGVDDRVRNRIRWNAARRPVGPRDVAAHRERELAGSDDPAATESILAAMDYPDRMPVFDMVVASAHNDLWVRRYAPDPDAEARWWVFSAEGRMLYAVALPGRLRIQEVGDDYVVGVWRDAAGVETVRRYGLYDVRDGPA